MIDKCPTCQQTIYTLGVPQDILMQVIELKAERAYKELPARFKLYRDVLNELYALSTPLGHQSAGIIEHLIFELAKYESER